MSDRHWACGPWPALKAATFFVVAALLALSSPTSADYLAQTSDVKVQEEVSGQTKWNVELESLLGGRFEAGLTSLRKGLGAIGIASAIASILVFFIILGHTVSTTGIAGALDLCYQRRALWLQW